MKTEILRMLREKDGYVSGQQLCEELGVSRTAVWKVINQLKEEGYQIEAVRNKGYHIAEVPDLLSKDEVQSLTGTRWAGTNVVYYEETDSTNIRAKALAEEGAGHGTLVIADRQNAGKGRRGRGWVSPKGENIYMSILLRPEFEPAKAPMLTLVMAYSVTQALRMREEINAKIKWPNDIVLHKKKICGILTEMSAEIDYINHVVIGVGINTNMDHIEEELADKATSLRIEEGRKIRRAELIAEVMERFEANYERFVIDGNLSGIKEKYNEMLVNQDRDVRVLEPGNEYDAHALGINETGELLVRKEDGTVDAVFAGEVSVRGIYGYV